MAKIMKSSGKGNAASGGQLRALFSKAVPPLRWALLFSFAANILLLALPMYSLQVLDRVMSSYNMNTLIMLTILTVGCFVFNAFFSALKNAVLNHIGEWLQLTLSPRLMGTAVENAAIGMPVHASQFQRDLANLKNFITSAPLATLMDAPFSIIFLLIIYMINPILGAVTLAGAVLLLLFGVVIEYATKAPVDESNTLMNKSLQFADASARNAEAVEAMGMLPTLVHQWEKDSRKMLDLANTAQGRSNLLNALSRFLRMIIQVAITGLGAWLALNNEITMGHVIAASIISGRALAPFEAAIGLWKQWIITRDSYHKLEKVLSEVPRMRGTMPLPAPGGKLRIENLVYTPPRASLPILKGINFELNAHESLGLIGPSAAGKSTLARLIMGILPATMGSVRLDGVDIFHWNRADLGQYVGYLPQDVELFQGTIKDNIARMQPDADPAKVIEAAQFAGCHEMILRLPQGYETEFSQQMLSLSPGQRQRIGLARALYNNPSFVVLDEPNSNLDGEGEVALQHAIIRMKQRGITFVLVAHKPSVVSHVDKILMLENGMMKDFGARDAVLKKYTRTVQNAVGQTQEAAGNG
jgi:ATP-binding cassette subfamily C exporter for protease/lipase